MYPDIISLISRNISGGRWQSTNFGAFFKKLRKRQGKMPKIEHRDNNANVSVHGDERFIFILF